VFRVRERNSLALFDEPLRTAVIDPQTEAEPEVEIETGAEIEVEE
jgi:hypothetical protein